MHIPELRRHLARYYGAYSNVSRARGKRLEVDSDGSPFSLVPRPTDDERDHSPDGKVLRRRWRQLIKRVYEVDPLVCPSCGGELRIVAFIVNHEVVDAILRHLERRARAGRVRGPPLSPRLEAAS